MLLHWLGRTTDVWLQTVVCAYYALIYLRLEFDGRHHQPSSLKWRGGSESAERTWVEEQRTETLLSVSGSSISHPVKVLYRVHEVRQSGCIHWDSLRELPRYQELQRVHDPIPRHSLACPMTVKIIKHVNTIGGVILFMPISHPVCRMCVIIQFVITMNSFPRSAHDTTSKGICYFECIQLTYICDCCCLVMLHVQCSLSMSTMLCA